MKVEWAEIADNTKKIISSAISSVALAMSKMHQQAMERNKAQAAQQACCEKYRLSVYIRHDLTCAISKMPPPQGLYSVNNPQNLTYLPDYCLSKKEFAFFWQKSVSNFPINQSTLLRLAKRINNRITQFSVYLLSIGYTNELLAANYPALFHGLKVVDIHDYDDGVVLVTRIR